MHISKSDGDNASPRSTFSDANRIKTHSREEQCLLVSIIFICNITHAATQ